jgi:putative ABC transport system permease protein
MSTRAAIGVVARHEWRRRWRGALVMGVAIGLIGGAYLAGLALVLRTATVADRLVAAVSPGDAVVSVFGVGELGPEVAALPSVERAWIAEIAVGRLEGARVAYLGVLSGPRRPEGLFEPVVLRGRLADDDRPDEVVVVEEMAMMLGLEPGDAIRLAMLTAEEVFQFDVGFGEPDGPTVDLVVTGVVRVPPGVLDQTPVLATPAFAASHHDSVAGFDVYVDLVDGEGSLGRLRSEVEELGREVGPVDGGEEFPPLMIADLTEGTMVAKRSTRILVIGMALASVASGVAGLLALGQVMARQQGTTRRDQRVLAALGLVSSERAIALTAPFVLTAAVAAPIAVGMALVWAGLSPPGSARRLEPHPGWLPNVWLLVAGVVVYIVAVLGASWWAAIGSGRAPSGRVPRAVLPSFVPMRSGWPRAGAAFALVPARGARGLPLRAGLVGAILGTAGLVAGIAFSASLDRLVAEPERYGWTADLTVVDVTPAILAELVDDERLVAIAEIATVPTAVGSVETQAYGWTPVRGDVGWTMLDGHEPAPGQVVAGTKIADRLGVEVGDVVQVGEVSLEVSGIGIGPVLNAEPFGRSVLVHPTDLPSVASVAPFHEALLTARPDDLDAVVADWSARYESFSRELPRPVRDLYELGSLPILLGLFLALVAALVLAHALVVTVRQRARDLAVMRALGSTRFDAGAVMVSMAVTTGLIGVVLGIPLGLALARLVWHEVAVATGVAGDLLVPPGAVVAGVGVLVGAMVLSLVPAVRAARTPPAVLLRGD